MPEFNALSQFLLPDLCAMVLDAIAPSDLLRATRLKAGTPEANRIVAQIDNWARLRARGDGKGVEICLRVASEPTPTLVPVQSIETVTRDGVSTSVLTLSADDAVRSGLLPVEEVGEQNSVELPPYHLSRHVPSLQFGGGSLKDRISLLYGTGLHGDLNAKN